jgi:glycosyltransferase involved in cell wall biosynthesis
VREADTLAGRGHEVRVIGVRHVPELVADDERLLSTRKWRLQMASILRSNRLRAGRSRLRRAMAAEFFRRSKSLRSAEYAVCEAAPELLRLASAQPADWFIAHTQTVLGVAAAAARKWNARLGFDCEDLLALTGHTDSAIIHTIEAAYLPACDYVSATSPAMAARLQAQYRIAAPVVLYNVFPLEMVKHMEPPGERPRAASLRLHWSGQTIGPGKGLEEAVEAAGQAGGRVELFVRGAPVSGFGETLSRMARERNLPLTFLPHLHHDDLLGAMDQFDVGLALERAAHPNYSITVTNKFFSYMLAGLALAATDTPGQREVFDQAPAAGFMYVSGRPDLLVAQLRRWRDDRDSLRAAQTAAWRAARERFCWDLEKTKFVALLEMPPARPARSPAT